MTSKELVNKLMKQIGDEFVQGKVSKESLLLAIQLSESLETPEEKTERLQKFSKIISESVA